ncbi:AsmA family protein [Tropicibacter sp. Alg240-R139]|uniref:AsmA family protein n=1 Tax=Tropicibacter sp. Alg240-R139 TaxID=2305991 RepID=UPI0013DFE400|nr:AsmA family protein [Tropicibacter sp. Alg240-R139]
MVLAKRLAIVAVSIAVVLVFLVWLLLFSAVLAEPRGDIAARFLSEHFGDTLKIGGSVELALDPGLRVFARDVSVSGDPERTSPPLEIAKISAEIELRGLLARQMRLSNIQIDGAQLSMIEGASGKSAQQTTGHIDLPFLKKGDETTNTNWKVEVTDRHVHFSNAEILYKNTVSGIDLDWQMSSMELTQDSSSASWVFDGKGALNKQALTVSGSISKDQSVSLVLSSNEMNLKIDGTPAPAGFSEGFTSNISAEFEKLAPLLDILRLEKTISGKGSVSAIFTASPQKRSLDDLKVQVTLDGGESLELTGDFGELKDLNDASLKMDISLYPPDAMPPPAKLRRDLKLTGFEMVVTAQPDGLPLRHMKVQTNGFTLNTHGKGPPPITVSNIKVTPDGLLDLGKVDLRIGPPGSYVLVFDGSIGDALRVADLDFEATVTLPLNVLGTGQRQNSDGLGKIVGGFHLKGDSTSLMLSDLNVKVQYTNLISLAATASAGNILSLSDLALDVSADVPSGAKLLSALEHSSVATGEIRFDAKLTSDGSKWQSNASFSIAQSDLELSLNADTKQPNPHLDGHIVSKVIRLEDIRHLIAAVREISPSEPSHNKTKLFTDVTLEPLTTEILSSGLNIDVQVDLKKIDGVAGTSAIKTEFVMKDEKAQMGPVKFEYDGGKIDVTGFVDVAKHPDILTLKGTADGWNFGTILQELNMKMRGSGILNASLNLSGTHKSISEFLRTMSGDLLVSMQNGRIHTRMVDLAGLGILPWLFSDDHGKVTPITCLRAPLRLNEGKITINEAALETSKVQLVANGNVNLRNETLDVTGEPRPIGKPLTRSPWPFVVSGSLKHPKLGLKKGSHRQKRSDGASTMPKHRKPCIADILQLR